MSVKCTHGVCIHWCALVQAASTHINLRSVETLVNGSREPEGAVAQPVPLQHQALRCGSHREAFESEQ